MPSKRENREFISMLALLLFCMFILQYVGISNEMPAIVYSNNTQNNHEYSRGLAGQKICIDPGHGGSDPGAVGYGLEEEDVNLDVALRLKDLLIADGATVVMTRTTDTDVSLQARCDIANNNGCNRFVSIHCNAYNGNAYGTETYYHSSLSSSSTAANLANKVNPEVVSHLGTYNRGVKQADYYVLRNTAMPAILVELAFIDNYNDNQKLASESYRQEAARAILHGLQSHYGETPHDPPVEPPAAELDAIYLGSSYNSTMEAGQEYIVWIEYKNNGTATWYPSTSPSTWLGTWNPPNRASVFYPNYNWGNNCRPSSVDYTTSPNSVGRFTFIVRAPAVADNNYTEYWRPIRGDTWFGPTNVFWQIRVRDTISPSPPAINYAPSGYTNDSTPYFDWADGSDVTGISSYLIRIDNEQTPVSPYEYEYTISNTGSASSQHTITNPLSDGIHYYFLYQKDGAGHWSAPAVGNFTVDTTPPTTPIPDDSISSPTSQTTVTFTWTNSVDSLSGLAGYYWKIDNGAETFTTANTVSVALPGEGTYTFYVRAKDNAGNIGEYGTHSVIVSTTAPGANTPVCDILYNSTGTVYWHWLGTPGSVGYYVSVGTSPNSSNIVNDVYTTNTGYTVSDLSNGIYYCRIKAKSASGVIGDYSHPSNGVIVDRTPPTVPSIVLETYPGLGADIDYSESNQYLVSWESAMDFDSGIDVYELQESTSPNSWNTISSNLKVTEFSMVGKDFGKVYRYRVRARNLAGLWSEYSQISDGIAINRLPTVEIGENMQIYSGMQQTLYASSSDPDGLVVNWSWHITGPANSNIDMLFYTQEITFLLNYPGLYNINCIATDNLGGTASDSIFIEVLNRAPIVDLISVNGVQSKPEDLGTVKVKIGKTIEFQCSANDYEDGLVTKYQWDFNGDGNIDAETTDGLSNGYACYTYNNAGTYTVLLHVFDSSSTKTTVTFKIEVGNNDPPKVFVDPIEGEIASDIKISGKASDSDGQVTAVLINFDNGSWQNVVGKTEWYFLWNISKFSDGPHTIYVKAYDGRDYSSIAIIKVVINRTSTSGPSKPDTNSNPSLPDYQYPSETSVNSNKELFDIQFVLFLVFFGGLLFGLGIMIGRKV